LDKFVTDQAEGLRRLLARGGPRVIAVTGGPGAPGRTTTVVNLAAALTAIGRQVLVIDECGGGRAVAALAALTGGAGETGAPDVGLAGRFDRFDAAARDERRLADAITRHVPGFSVLAAPRSDPARHATEPLSRLLRGHPDIVLIDAQLDEHGALSPLALNAHDVLLVTRTDAQAITVAYACIKRLHFAHAIGQFRVLANHVQSDADARIALDNLVGVAGRYLAVALERAGSIAADPHMPRAVELARAIVDAFPSTAAARDYRCIAAELPHWPLRPALAMRATSRADRADGAVSSGDGFGDAPCVVGLQDVTEVSGGTRVVEAVPARAGWQAGPPAGRRATHHA